MAFVKEFDVKAPPATVWAVLADIERWPDWSPACNGVKPEQAGPLAVGNSAMLDLRGRPNAERWTVTSLEEGRSFVWETRPWPGMRVEGGHSVEPTATGSRVRLWIGGKGLLGAIMSPMIDRMSRENVEMEADGLTRRSEEIANG